MLTLTLQTIFYCLLTFMLTTNIILINISYGGKMGLISFFKNLFSKSKKKKLDTSSISQTSKNVNSSLLQDDTDLNNKAHNGNPFFNKLREEYKGLFEALGFIPSNFDEANNFLKSYYGLDRLDDFKVVLRFPVIIERQKVQVVEINKNFPYYCLIPNVWRQMTIKEKLNATMMLYNIVLNEKMVKLNKKPVIRFISDDDNSNSNGYYDSVNNALQLSLYSFLDEDSSSLQLIKTIAHELTHVQQERETKETFNFLRRNNFDYSLLTSYQKHLFFNRTSMVFDCIGWAFDAYKKMALLNLPLENEYLSKNDMELWLILEQNKSGTWFNLKYLCYACNQNEISAQNVGQKIFNKVSKEYVKDYQIASGVRTSADEVIAYMQKNGFDIPFSAKENFAQINYYSQMYSCFETSMEIVSYLLEIYKTHKVTRLFKENYQEYEDEYFRRAQKNLLEYYGNIDKKSIEYGE